MLVGFNARDRTSLVTVSITEDVSLYSFDAVNTAQAFKTVSIRGCCAFVTVPISRAGGDEAVTSRSSQRSGQDWRGYLAFTPTMQVSTMPFGC